MNTGGEDFGFFLTSFPSPEPCDAPSSGLDVAPSVTAEDMVTLLVALDLDKE